MSPRTRAPKPDEAPSAVMPPNTLVSLMGDDAFSQDELYERYGDAATIPQHMLGIIPNSGHYFEIWPPASRVCFTIVPNFLNAPLMLFGLGAPKNLISLAMFASSIGADCSYCIAHTCTFSMRRGVQPEKLTLEAIADRHSPTSKFTSVEAAVIDVAESIGQVPSTLTHEMKQTLIKEIGDAATTEWVVTVVGMMGFLNKSMDALGIPLEVNCYQETRDVLGKAWSPRANAQLLKPDEQPPLPPPATDGVFRYFRMMLQGPGAAAFERKALAGIPDSWALSSKFLLEHTGYDFPLLEQLQHRRVIRAITAVMRESLNSSTTVVGLKLKVAAAQIFATIAQSKPIQQLTDAIAKHFEVDEAYLALAKSVALDQDPIPLVKTVFADEDGKTQALLVVAHGSSWSRVRIDESTVALCRDAGVASAAMVEVTVWVSVLQMLHRLSVYFLMDEPESAP